MSFEYQNIKLVLTTKAHIISSNTTIKVILPITLLFISCALPSQSHYETPSTPTTSNPPSPSAAPAPKTTPSPTPSILIHHIHNILSRTSLPANPPINPLQNPHIPSIDSNPRLPNTHALPPPEPDARRFPPSIMPPFSIRQSALTLAFSRPFTLFSNTISATRPPRRESTPAVSSSGVFLAAGKECRLAG